jgi:mannose-6-phosphate isomerase-like protein (cupin superfamily)
MTEASYRRVVTGLDEAGRSCVLVDGPVVPVGDALGVVWRTGPPPVDNAPMADAATGDFSLARMQEGGTFFLVYEHPPHSDGFWHATDTLDYIVMLEGEVILELESGDVRLRAGDLLVDRGVLHRWRNETARVARTAIVNIAALPVDEGRTV